MLDKDKPIQLLFSLVCLAIALFFLVGELWENRHSPSGLQWDYFTKISVGIGAVGLLLAPFNFTNVWEAIKQWRNK